MKRLFALAAMGALCIGCGEIQEAKEAANAMSQLAEAGEKMAETQDEATKFMAERKAKGDTVAMATDQLKTFLPTAIDGYKPKAEPSVQSTNMGAFSYSTAEQEWVSLSSADSNNPAVIKVTLTDWSGSEGGYMMYAPMMAMNISQEDAHRRTGSVKLDMPHTAGWEEFDKDSKNAKFTAMTRYRFMINVETSNQTDDQSAVAKEIAVTTAEKFKDK